MATPDTPNVVFGTTPIVGTALNRRTNASTETQPIEFALGTTILDMNGKVWIYVHAPTTIPSNATCTIIFSAGSTPSVDCSTVGAKTVQNVVNGTAAFAQNDYGWVQSVRRLWYATPIANVS